MEMRKAEMEERERRKNGLSSSKSQTNVGHQRKTDSPTPMPNGRIPKLNSSTNAPSNKPTPKLSPANDNRKPNNATFEQPMRPVSSITTNKSAAFKRSKTSYIEKSKCGIYIIVVCHAWQTATANRCEDKEPSTWHATQCTQAIQTGRFKECES